LVVLSGLAPRGGWRRTASTLYPNGHAIQPTSGRPLLRPLNLPHRNPPIDLSIPHTYQLKFGTYESAPLTVNPAESSLNTAWDAATASIKDRPGPPISATPPWVNIMAPRSALSTPAPDASLSPDAALIITQLQNTVVLGDTVFVQTPIDYVVSFLSSKAPALDDAGTPVKFVLAPPATKNARPLRVTVDFHNANLHDMLNTLCAKTDCTYQLGNGTVTLAPP